MADKKTKLVGIYIRISSDKQKEEGLSSKVQEKTLIDFCEEKEWNVYKLYKDEGISGYSIKKRKGFLELLNDARNGIINVILILKFDRAFRNVMEAIMTLDEMSKIGVDFVSKGENIDTTTPYGRAMFQLISVFAELERNLTASRMDDIQNYKFSKGLMLGRCPIGYKPIFEDKKKRKKIIEFIVDPKKSEIVKEVFEMTADGVRWKDILDKFKISRSTYYDMIKNKTYVGIISYNGVERQGSHKPLISKELFKKVNPNVKFNIEKDDNQKEDQ